MSANEGIETGEFLAAEQAHSLPGGPHFKVRLMGRKRIRGAVSDHYLEVLESADGSAAWQPVRLRACPLHAHRAQASDWPPEAALSSAVQDGHLVVEYESRYDPWAKAAPTRLSTHSRWQARYDTRWRWWYLKQLEPVPDNQPATR